MPGISSRQLNHGMSTCSGCKPICTTNRTSLAVTASFGWGMDWVMVTLSTHKHCWRSWQVSCAEGGRILIDSGVIAESILVNFKESDEYEFGGIQMSSRRSYEPLLGCMDIEYTFRRSGVVEVRGCRQWIFMLAQFRRMLENTGWRLVHALSDVNETPYRLGDQYAYLVAEKV